MRTLILDASALKQLVHRVGLHDLMDNLTARLVRAFESFDADVTEIPPRTGFHYDDPTGLVEWMPLHQRGDKILMKLVGYHPQAPSQHGVPTIVSTVSLYDTSTGHLAALADSTFLTAMRTGAASAVASSLLASPESETLGLVGCGAQAVTQYHALSRCFDFRQVLLYDVDQRSAESFADRVASITPGPTRFMVSTLEAISAKSDIICTATTTDAGNDPVISLENGKPWLHVNAVGSDLPGKTELPLSFLEKSFVCPDTLTQACIEGECQQLEPDQIGSSIVEVAKSPNQFADIRTRQSVFDSTGWALEDWVAIELAIELAAEVGVGTSVALELLSADPKNPYDFVRGPESQVAKSQINLR